MWLSKQLFLSLSSSPPFLWGRSLSRQGLLTVQGEEEYRQPITWDLGGFFPSSRGGRLIPAPAGRNGLSGAFQKFPDTLQPGNCFCSPPGAPVSC